MEAVENDGELVSLSSERPTQKVFRRLIKQSLTDVEYENDSAARWRPATNIVLDPRRQFGRPIVEDFGLATATLAFDAANGADASDLAELYEVPIRAIKAALAYERSLDPPTMVH
ncbi:MAG: DUF433 domain-containing protein [Shimia sp.]